MTPDLAADSVRREQCLHPGSNPLQLEALDGVADYVASPARQRPHADGLLAGCRGDRKLTLALQQGEIGPGQLHQRNLMRAPSLAWASLAGEDRQGIITHVSPLQPDELFDALAAGQHMQPQRRGLDARTRIPHSGHRFLGPHYALP